ncbi:MAG: hypothetical protein P4L64_02955 [Caulobacteraceae bacterium]|nr:hypothetical protein [Caulobacteraceae bacterium]
MNPRLLLATLFLTSAALGGCGKIGSLEQPAPLYGAKAKADWDAKQRAAAEEKAKKKADNAEPDHPADPLPPPLAQAPYSTPMPGAGSNPFGRVPQGSLPNPGTTPDQ